MKLIDRRSGRSALAPVSRAPRRGRRRASARLLPALGFAAVLAVCLGPACTRNRAPARPNVLWIVWDTVRADRLSLYGHERPTTPFLDEWAGRARVFDNCSSIASTTVPAHASMFTDLLPIQHGADNVRTQLREEFRTLPEIFQGEGYQTCMYSENPYLSRESGFGQGFDAVYCPWDEELRLAAAGILEQKIPSAFRNPRLGARLREPGITHWALTACGRLGETTVLDWLERRDRHRPFFVFMNYMEAHAPVIAPEEYRARWMSPAEVRRSYLMNVSPLSIWLHSFRLEPYSSEDLDIIGRTYDAALAELDDLLRSLVGQLERRGLLRNTIVVVCSDHGEHLGEHHLLDHEYSLYEPLLKVPMILCYPPEVPPGREARPVMNIDLYPTLLELTGIDTPPDSTGRASPTSVSLLAPREARTRIASFPAVPTPPFEMVRAKHPEFDPTPYVRALHSVERNGEKLIWASNRQNELFDLKQDPQESRNLLAERPGLAAALTDTLSRILTRSAPAGEEKTKPTRWTEEQKAILRSLGYTGTED